MNNVVLNHNITWSNNDSFSTWLNVISPPTIFFFINSYWASPSAISSRCDCVRLVICNTFDVTDCVFKSCTDSLSSATFCVRSSEKYCVKYINCPLLCPSLQVEQNGRCKDSICCSKNKKTAWRAVTYREILKNVLRH